MPFRDFLIRLAASCLYILRRSACTRADLTLVVFSGTAGKTLARNAVAYALQKKGSTVISLPYGYTNELGMVLACLGIEEPIRLHSLAGIRRVLTARASRNAYICVEVGADWRTDVPWFVRRFAPTLLCLTDLDTLEWARSLPTILGEKKKLVASVRLSGAVVLSRANPSCEQLSELVARNTRARIFEFESNPIKLRIGEHEQEWNPVRTERAHLEASGFALSALTALFGKDDVSPSMLAGYEPPSDRLKSKQLASGITLISDIYKAVPYCVQSAILYALSQPASRRIAVVSAMHPLCIGVDAHYARMVELLRPFDTVYFVGPPDITALIVALDPRSRALSGSQDYRDLAQSLYQELTPGTQLLIKGAGRYHLERLVAELQGCFPGSAA